MRFLKSRSGAAVVLVLAVIFSTVFGAHRSLRAVRDEIFTLYVQGEKDDGHSVSNDLFVRFNTGLNLCAVAERYSDRPEVEQAAKELSDLLYEKETEKDAAYYEAVEALSQVLIEKLNGAALSEQDAKYVAGFAQELESRAFTISNDPYTAAAKEFNETTLGSFPASVLGPLAGIRELPVYQ